MGQLQRLEANVAGCRDAAWATGEGMDGIQACPCHPPHTLIHSHLSSHIDTPQQGGSTPPTELLLLPPPCMLSKPGLGTAPLDCQGPTPAPLG